MTADEIRERLEDAGLRPHHEWTAYDGDLTLEVSGPPSAWQKALGPTREQVESACQDAFAHMTFGGSKVWCGLDPEDGFEFIAALTARLYP